MKVWPRLTLSPTSDVPANSPPADYGQLEAFVGLQTLPQTRFWVKALFLLLVS